MSRRSPRAAPRNLPLSSAPGVPVIRIPASVRYAFRPSVRLKALLCALSAGVLTLIVLALNAAHGGRLNLLPGGSIINRDPTVGTPADSAKGLSIAQGRDEEKEEPEINRSFEEPDFALLTSPQPHEIGCDVPLEGDNSGVVLFLGIFSSASGKARRDLYRKHVIPDFPPELVTVKFILGRQAVESVQAIPGKFKNDLSFAMEQAAHGDMVMLDIIDNIDNGKTHEYFKWVARTYGGKGHVKGRPRFVMKADDDTFLVMPNIISAFKALDCTKNVYWGTSAGRSSYFGQYFRGLAYALSWPLVSWIGNSGMSQAHVIKIEDARTGQWLRELDPVTDPLHVVDLGWSMGDWNQLDYTTGTVALHWLKESDWVVEQREKILEVWKDAGRPYDKNSGVPLSESIKHGQQMPSSAREEAERQKDLGWDSDNVVDEMGGGDD